MRITVIGAGIVGVATALELALDGHEVTVLERRSGVAVEGSFAPGGWQAHDSLAAWGSADEAGQTSHRTLAALGALGQALRHPSHLTWSWQQWRASHPARRPRTRRAAHQLGQLSRERLGQLTQALGLDHEHSEGSLLLLNHPRELAWAQRTLPELAAAEVRHTLLDAEQARRVEPGLTDSPALLGALHLPGDSAGNCRQLAHLLKAEAQRRGVRFCFDTDVLEVRSGPPWRLICRQASDAQAQEDRAPQPRAAVTVPTTGITGEHLTDGLVICTGVTTARWLAALGAALPLLIQHGHTITAPLPVLEATPDIGPRSVVVDARRRVQISRLGVRVRVTGLASTNTPSARSDRATWDSLYRALEAWFPGAARTSQAQEWRGACAALPDLLPAIGAGPQPGLWFNLGHGAQGWTWACGAARLLADQIGGRPVHDWQQSLNPQRWR